MPKLLGIDVGTSGCKVLLIDETGRVLKEASAEYPLSVPQPLWSEQNPEDWWIGVQKCLAEIGEKPDAIGVTGQMHGAVFLDENDEVIRPAILWNDQRTAEECREIDNSVGPDRVRQITCNPPLTGFQAPKILWLRNNELSNYQRIRTVLLPKDYIRFKLTGDKATEVSDASGTGLLDVPRRAWSAEMMARLEIDASLFPTCFESHEITGRTAEGIPVVGGGGDQAAGAVGTGAVRPGVISVSLGTSGVVFTAIDAPNYDPRGAAHTFCHANRAWHAMGVMLSCGGALRWYRDTLARGGYDEIAKEAAEAPVGSDGLTFLPYLTGERCPHNDPLARGAFAGITLGHTRSHFSRALFEGISFGLLEGMDLLRGLGATAAEIRVTSGGAKSRFWLQMLADMFGTPCVTLQSDEGPAFGAAILAGVGIGVWPDVKTACDQVVRVKDRVEPGVADYGVAYARYRSLYEATRPWGHEIAS
ncbi:xylulokinase [Fimbriimonas ginsengisoli]|uniref:Xylulose kinase n=1 Tax=Fimbriimonas ginsengisoli Gsoil 348 TaxID=661478 RepID=A0A068NM50_FIMGI|nr:xylulokinase [Fimbriimonas ginsengisoli]AIE84633.1 xylulokinase [Fimbriimonas ginsengisoli Gsoil 348]